MSSLMVTACARRTTFTMMLNAPQTNYSVLQQSRGPQEIIKFGHDCVLSEIFCQWGTKFPVQLQVSVLKDIALLFQTMFHAVIVKMKALVVMLH